MNQWNIPEWLEKEVIERDKVCVYCSVEFLSAKESKKSMATWEHIVNDARIITRKTSQDVVFLAIQARVLKSYHYGLNLLTVKIKEFQKIRLHWL